MKIALLGDIALFGEMSVNVNYNLADYFSDIADYLNDFDYVVGNLETPFSAVKKTNGAKSAFICSDIANVEILKQLHISAVSLANNHMFDYGNEGYETTKRVLKENGIEFFGTEGKELRIEHGGSKIVFSGFCCYTSGPLMCVPIGEYGVNAYNIITVENCLKKNDKDGWLNIVAVHAGLEHVNYPSIEHIRAARRLAEVVPFVYYGHHPHVIQGLEVYKGSIIAHSLGNFCFDDIYTRASGNKPLIKLTENNRHGMILELSVDGNRVTNYCQKIIYNSKDRKMVLVEDTDSLKEYNEAIIHCESDTEFYTAKRNAILGAQVSERKSVRNIRWYLVRLRPMYLRLIINAIVNKKKYSSNVLKYIKND